MSHGLGIYKYTSSAFAECLLVDPATCVRLPARAGKIFSLYDKGTHLKIFYLPQPGIEPKLLDLHCNTLPRRCKSQLLQQGSRSVFIYNKILWHSPPPI